MLLAIAEAKAQRCNHETEGRHRRNTTVLGILPSAWAARDVGLEQWLHRSEERGPATNARMLYCTGTDGVGTADATASGAGRRYGDRLSPPNSGVTCAVVPGLGSKLASDMDAPTIQTVSN